MEKLIYEDIKAKYGLVASWAIWNHEDVRDVDIIQNSLQYLKPNIVLVGLNISKNILTPFSNFHRSQNDLKLGLALKSTPCHGAYMTDLIKNRTEGNSLELKKSLTGEAVLENIDTFKKELSCLGSGAKTIVAMHGQVHKILTTYLGHLHKIYRITHYSYRFKGCHEPAIYAGRIHKELAVCGLTSA